MPRARYFRIQTFSLTDKPFHNFRAFKSVNRRILFSSERHETDFKATKLWKGLSGLTFSALIPSASSWVPPWETKTPETAFSWKPWPFFRSSCQKGLFLRNDSDWVISQQISSLSPNYIIWYFCFSSLSWVDKLKSSRHTYIHKLLPN